MTSIPSSTALASSEDRAFFGHPRGLGLLFMTEMWERFSYYGMRALLVLYLVNKLEWDTARAAGVYGTYTMLVFLTPMIGGYLADRFIGTHRALIIGGFVIASGHFVLAIPGMSAFYAGLGLVVIGTDPPGRTFCEPDGTHLGNVYVGVQIRSEPEHLVRGDSTDVRWELEIRTPIDSDGALDFHGAAVHGKRGDRFVYLTWGNIDGAGEFTMFRRAKLMLNRVDPDLMRAANEYGHLTAIVQLSDGCGAPRCARVDPPAVTWSAS